MGDLNYSVGEYEKALNYFEEALNIVRDLKELNSDSYPVDIVREINNYLNYMGSTYRSLGRYRKALSYYEKALNINKEFDIRSEMVENLNDIGSVYHFYGQHDLDISRLNRKVDSSS